MRTHRAWVLLGLTSCFAGGAPPSPSPTGAVDAACPAGPPRLRALTRRELERTLERVLATDGGAARRLPPERRAGPFPSGGALSEPLVQGWMELAEHVADAVVETGAGLPCREGPGCVDALLDTLGARLLRRPLEPAEREDLAAIHADGRRAEGSFAGGTRWLLTALLQSPDFVYLTPGEPERDRAQRLAFFLTGGPPDPSLEAAAERGALRDPEGLRRQAARLLDDPRARELTRRFVVGWLDLERLEQIRKSPRHLRFDDAAREAMLEETVRFADAIFREGRGNLHTLMTAGWSVLSEPLLPIYGMAVPPGFDPGRPVSLLKGERHGILTHASVLATHAGFDESSPIARGSMILDHLLCRTIPLPDLDIPDLPEPVPGQSARERFEQHTSNPACATCHRIIDPIGFALEGYDAVGGFRRAFPDGRPVDDHGVLALGDPAIDGPMRGARELVDRILRTDAFPACFVTQWMRLALGRELGESDRCSHAALLGRFRRSGYDIRALILDLATSRALHGAEETTR